jgi:hypothetical protein
VDDAAQSAGENVATAKEDERRPDCNDPRASTCRAVRCGRRNNLIRPPTAGRTSERVSAAWLRRPRR